MTKLEQEIAIYHSLCRLSDKLGGMRTYDDGDCEHDVLNTPGLYAAIDLVNKDIFKSLRTIRIIPIRTVADLDALEAFVKADGVECNADDGLESLLDTVKRSQHLRDSAKQPATYPRAGKTMLGMTGSQVARLDLTRKRPGRQLS